MPSPRALIVVVAAAGLLSSGCNFIFNPAKSDDVIRCKNATECETNDVFADVLATERVDASCKAPVSGTGNISSSKNNLVCSTVDKASVSCDATLFPEDTPLFTNFNAAKSTVYTSSCTADKKGTNGCPSLNGNCDSGDAPNQFDVCDDGSGKYPFADPSKVPAGQDVLDQHCRSFFCDDSFVCSKNKCIRCDDDDDAVPGEGACADLALYGKRSTIYTDVEDQCPDASDVDETQFGKVVEPAPTP